MCSAPESDILAPKPTERVNVYNSATYEMSPGGTDWGIVAGIGLGAVFLWAFFVARAKYKNTRAFKDKLAMVFFGLFVLGSIPAGMVVHSYTSAAIVLDDYTVSVSRRPIYGDQGIELRDIASYEVTTLRSLGGVEWIDGYSDGNERIGWFRMNRGNRRVFVCAAGEGVLFIEGRNGELFILAPPEPTAFLERFEKRMGALGK